MRDFYDTSDMIYGREDTSNIFANGYYNAGWKIIEPIMERIRQTAEEYGRISDILLYNSFSGGSGSALASLLLPRLKSEFTRNGIAAISLFPSEKGGVTEPYNTILSIHRIWAE